MTARKIVSDIRDDIPLPPLPRVGRGGSPEGRKIKDDMLRMKKGESFFVAIKDRTPVQIQGKIQNTKQRIERTTAMRFTTRQGELNGKAGCRVWRVA
jgi:hypothetical protein